MNFTVFLLLLPSVVVSVIIGANDAGSLLGPTIANGIFKMRKALYFSIIFILLGSLIEGMPNLKVASNLVKVDTAGALIINISSAAVALFFLRANLPISMTQAIVGASVGVGFLLKEVNTEVLLFIALGWFATPVASFAIAYLFFKIFALIFRGIKNLGVRELVLRTFLWSFTLYGAFSFGANNAGKITGLLLSQGVNPYLLLLVGGLSLVVGVYFFGKRSINTIGRELVALDDFSAMVSISASAVTLWLFSAIGLPISASHSIVGSIVGVGYARGTRIRNERIFNRVLFSWLQAPLYSGIFSALLFSIFKLLW
ncbi:inorganic phosphate transporter [Fervidobacterium gondwanense]|uniref:Inorganic phosphate transporter, PiT family n=1 Tax=Fervidobacterium gondwanense DSM 13020 TaxID=1121883 RepID=A0A1M7T6R3_FERGO|nr:inorganic phosphate transporter [Fervidobacterium gondwanense]SHN66441.1 inorganic phosphate transporter, PiT family [Fervidobacterium gondwanense DSM 13020]